MGENDFIVPLLKISFSGSHFPDRRIIYLLHKPLKPKTMNKKNLLAILAGSVASLVLGWLVYDVILKEYYAANTMAGVNKADSEFIWWAMILGMLAGVSLLVYVLNHADANTFIKGAMTALWVSLLMALSYDFYFYAGTNLFTKPEVICVDAVSGAVQGFIIGGVAGWVRGMVGKPAVAMAG
jgi:magnesium-transporting ATPase (P-type)